jgi:hypothetical protein
LVRGVILKVMRTGKHIYQYTLDLLSGKNLAG